MPDKACGSPPGPFLAGRWAPVTAAQLEAYEAIEGKSARRLARHVLANARFGGSLPDFEFGLLANYAYSYGFDARSMGSALVVQLGAKDAERACGSKRSGPAALRQLQECGFISKVSDGVRGHSSLYLVGPFVPQQDE